MTITIPAQPPLPPPPEPDGPGPEPVVELTEARMLKVASDVVFMQKKMAADLLEVAVCWADAHPPARPECVMDWWDGEDVPVSGNLPQVDRAAVIEFSPAIGKTVHSGGMVIYEALQLRHRMPHIWNLVREYVVPAWKATKLVMECHLLNDEAVGFIDRQVGAAGGDVGWAQLERLALQAAELFDPEFLVRKEAARYVHIRHQVNEAGGPTLGASQVHARMDHLDALDLDAALDVLAGDSRAAGVTADRDVRRAHALGDLARSVMGQDALDLAGEELIGGDVAGGDVAGENPAATPVPETGRRVGLPPRVTPVREHTLYYHLSQDAVTAMLHDDDRPRLGECGTIRRPVLVEQIRAWCGNPDATIIVKPVVDLCEPIITNAYRPTPAQREHLALTESQCVFPECTHRVDPVPVRRQPDGTLAESWDADHIVAWRPGERTSTAALAPLCRRHHGAKTHEGWRYRKLATGFYLWRSPAGAEYLRSPSGTFECAPAPAREPEPPGWLQPIPEPSCSLDLDVPEERVDPYVPPPDSDTS